MSNNTFDILKKFEKALEKYNVPKDTIFYNILDTVYMKSDERKPYSL